MAYFLKFVNAYHKTRSYRIKFRRILFFESISLYILKQIIGYENKLKRDGILDEEILFAGKQQNDSIENLFADADKKRYNISENNETKGVLARKFYEKVKREKLTFEQKTITNFEDLLNQIKSEINISRETGGIKMEVNPVTESIKDDLKEQIKSKKEKLSKENT